MAGSSTDIWGRIVGGSWQELAPDAAQHLLDLQFSGADKRRISELSTLANEGKLSNAQRVELEALLDVASLLGVIHSHARRALSRGDASRRRKVS